MQIRLESPADRPAIDRLVERAFGAEGRVVADLVRALRRDDPGYLSFVAVETVGEAEEATEDGEETAGTGARTTGTGADDGSALLGHVMFTRSLLDAPSRLLPVQVLSPLAVAPERQRQGVGTALIRHGVAELARRDVPLVFLEGDPAYYSKQGFVAGDGLGFRKPSLRIPDAAFQVMPLAGHQPWMTGTLVYLHTFWDLDCVGLR